MIKEIGSEFHRMSFESGRGLTFSISGSLVFSGRTAIETVLKTIKGAKKALLPSYCCDSMIQPFRDAGIRVEFYPVNYENGLKIDVPDREEANIVLWCNYFGFHDPLSGLADFQGIIIEDVTHNLFSEQIYHPQSQYIVASLRKWEPVRCGGYCAAVNGNLLYPPIASPPEEFIRKKDTAMRIKAEYLNDQDETKKQQYLTLFSESNHWLADNYSGLTIDPWSREYLKTVDMEEQKKIRRRNARVLYEGLKGKVEFLFPEEYMDCPLFVPILVPNRDEVRAELTSNKIYCPVHWPKPEGCESNLYYTELSLVCDQRYDEEDMERVVSVLQSIL